MNRGDVCVGCGSDRVIVTETQTRVCSDCTLQMAGSSDTMDYGAAYSNDDSLYGEHLRALDRFQTTPNLTPLLLPFERRIIAQLASESGIRQLVDLGCGTGRFLRAAELAGLDAKGFEVASPLVERLQRHGLCVRRGGIEEFLDSSESPDIITLLEVVEHLPRPGASMDELIRRKAPKRLFVVVPEWETRRRYDARFAAHDIPPNHLTWWNPRALAALLGRRGYVVSVEAVPECRRSLLGHIVRSRRRRPPASVIDWLRALARPPAFWLLARAQRP